ncbi:MAG: hypothetical protein RL557_660 [archaeon]
MEKEQKQKEPFEKRVQICFKGNDVRCLYDKELDERLAYEIGKAIVSYLNCGKIVVGHDVRFSSPALKKALINGITDEGCDVIDIGMIDTPGLYFASGLLDLPGAIVTASHNPIEYNGIKIVDKRAVPIGMGSGLEKIKEIVLKGNFKEEKKKGKIVEKNILPDYRKHILSFIDTKKMDTLSIVVDAGNGIAGKIVPLVSDALPVHIIPLCFDISGYFPNHGTNPLLDENTKELRETVVKKNADFGVAFDADMDRVFFIDEKGTFLNSSLIAACIIDHFSREIKKDGFVYSLVTSRILEDIARKNDYPLFKEKVGHSFIKKTMKQKHAFFGCEHSGHFYFKDNWFADTGIITALIVFEIFSHERKKNKKVAFSELFERYKKYAYMREKSFVLKNREHAPEKIIDHFSRLKPTRIDKLDGFSFDFGSYWFNIRFSQTEPLLRFNFEAINETILKEKSAEIEAFLGTL